MILFLKWPRFVLEEVRFIKSFNDIKIFCSQKLPFLLPRLIGKSTRCTVAPPSLQLEPVNYCNLKCICCPTGRMKRGKGKMDMELFKKIIDDASEIGVKRIHLYLNGEPMIHPHIVDMFRYIKKKGLGITMATNGMLFTREKIESILYSGVNSGDYITFSVLGYSKETHEGIMKGLDHEKVKENISTFIELRKKHNINGPIIEVILYRMPENIHEEADFIRYWRSIVDHVHPLGEISFAFAEYNKGDGRIIPVRKKTCKNLWERMAIHWNGDVTVCCQDLDGEFVMGNLGEKSIKDLWNCEEMFNVKQIHREKDFEKFSLCKRCDW